MEKDICADIHSHGILQALGTTHLKPTNGDKRELEQRLSRLSRELPAPRATCVSPRWRRVGLGVQRAAPTAAGHALNTRPVLLPFLCSSLSQPWTPSLLLTPLHTPLASRPALQQECRARKRTPSHTLRLCVWKPSSPTPPPREGTRAWSQILKSRRLVAEEREVGSALLAPPQTTPGRWGRGRQNPSPQTYGGS